jgi:hypothetical protein
MSRAVFDHEAALRYALHAAADQVQPREDGLERIQARLRGPRLLPVAWLEAAWTRLSLRLPEGFHLRPAADRVRQELRAAWERFGPQSERGVKLGWLRPVAAMSVAVFIVAAVVYTAIEVPQVVSPSSNNKVASSQRSGGHNGQPGQGDGNGHSQPPGSQSSGPGTSSGTNHSTCPTPGPSTSVPVIVPAPTTSSSTPTIGPSSPSTNPSSSPSGSPSPSTSSPSPSTTPSSSGSPSSTPVNPGSGSGSSTPSVAAGSSAASGGQAEGDGVASPSSSSVKPANSSSTANRSGSAAGSEREANPSPSPCPSKSPTKHKTHSTGSPAAAGPVLVPAVTTGQPGTEPDGQLYF